MNIHLIGNAHLDPAWMWRMPEGFAAFSATCRSALDRMKEFPGFIFTASSAAHYAFVEQTDATLFAEIQQAVREGRWEIAGGWWVEADCNLPSGESFIRQALLGQRYFESRFGKIVTVGYNIDSFGHNKNLPQLLKKAGMDSYVFMRPQQEEKKLPAALFGWEAPSGDRVAAYRLPFHYSNWKYAVREKIELLPTFEHFDASADWMLFFGVGNHGGGPTIEQLREIESLQREGKPVSYSSPARFFASVDQANIPTVREEMLPHAIGCYSAHSEIKRLNRLAEIMLAQAEAAEVLATMLGVPNDFRNGLRQAWENVCFNQFHDILGGVAISEACDDAISMYREALSIAERVKRISLQRIAARIDTSEHIENLIVFNFTAHERRERIEFELWHPHASEKGEPIRAVFLLDEAGTKIPAQQIEASGKIGGDRVRFLAPVSVPAFGWRTYAIERVIGEPLFVSKPQHTELPFEYAAAMIVRDDSDTWSHGEQSFMDFEEPFQVDSMETHEGGPLRKSIRVCSHVRNSRMEEEIFIEEGSEVYDIRYLLDWREQHKMLKLRFPHGCKDPVATYEIPYAWTLRPIGNEEWPGQKWVNVSERDGSHGIATVTDSKYSYSVDENYLYVVAARSPLYAHHVPPHDIKPGEQLRSLDQGEQAFRILLIRHDGNWSGSAIAQIESPLIAHLESRHAGALARSFTGIERRGCGVHIGAIKKAEEGSGIIVRAVECAGEASESDFAFPMLGVKWNARFSAFEIKTFEIDRGTVSEVDFLERAL
ncbi:MAG TPA: glycoside hydrolase family 38 C-terminal domain-containing protein [Candidatus Kapabacteria bacterium]|jgi:alpha-mannosidase